MLPIIKNEYMVKIENMECIISMKIFNKKKKKKRKMLIYFDISFNYVL